MVLHVDAKADELDAFGLEAHALFESVLAGEENLASGADDALPRDSGTGTVEGPCGLTGRAGESGSVSDVSVGGDLALRDTTDPGEDLLKHVGFGRGLLHP